MLRQALKTFTQIRSSCLSVGYLKNYTKAIETIQIKLWRSCFGLSRSIISVCMFRQIVTTAKRIDRHSKKWKRKYRVQILNYMYVKHVYFSCNC